MGRFSPCARHHIQLGAPGVCGRVGGLSARAHLNPAVTFDIIAKGRPAATKLAAFSTNPEIRSYGRNFFNEVAGAFLLASVILQFGNSPDALGPLAVALLIIGIGLSLGGPTGTRSTRFMTSVRTLFMHFYRSRARGSDWAYSWVPVFGPILRRSTRRTSRRSPRLIHLSTTM